MFEDATLARMCVTAMPLKCNVNTIGYIAYKPLQIWIALATKINNTLTFYHITATFAQLKTTVTLNLFTDYSGNFLELAQKKNPSQPNLQHY